MQARASQHHSGRAALLASTQLLLLLLVLFGAHAAGAASRDCRQGCAAIVDAVCGEDGVSYMNPCVAECSGNQAATTPGYCAGDNVRFRVPGGAVSSPKERAAVVTSAVLRKFADEGFSYVGYAPLSRAPQRPKIARLFPGGATAGSGSSSGSRADSGGGGSGSGFSKVGSGVNKEAAAASTAALSAAGSKGTATTAQQGLGPDGFPSDIVTYTLPSGNSAPLQLQKVEIMRGDPQGNVFYKSYMYDQDASGVYAYPPRLPSDAGLRRGAYGPTESAQIRTRSPPPPLRKPAPKPINKPPAPLAGSPKPPPAKPKANTVARSLPAAPARQSAGRRLMLTLQSVPAWWASLGFGRRGGSASGAADSTPSSGSARGAGAGGAALHRFLSVIGKDERIACPVNSYPFGAMGQLESAASDGAFMCSGALIAPDRLLTAAHCVWDDRSARSFFEQLAFHPAQFKTAAGVVNKPEGRVDWDHVTTFKAYIDDPDMPSGLQFDIAVIKLVKPIGLKYGWLGMRADRAPCGSGERVQMTLAGYPGDDPFSTADDYYFGGCFYDRCNVNVTCAQAMTTHACDSYIGQSGAPMYDPAYYIRMVHTLGLLPGMTQENSAVTISKFILDQVMLEWAGPHAEGGVLDGGRRRR
ncbi:MAG: trypsin-like cysteine/serine peptidase domain-containing protein [Monoraphidium minutum]|nr:MAG: trypsin-like cysteine/serine peptidase domain-containing protein [Monoraphidium minutum]